MALNPRSKTFRVLFAVVAVLVIYKMAFWFGDKPTTVPRAPLEVSEPAADDKSQQGKAEEDLDASVEEKEPAQPARRIVHVPDTRIEAKNNTISARPAPEAMVQPVANDAADDLEKALAGNLSSAIKLKRALNRCEKVPETKTGLEATIERLKRLLAHREKIGHPAQEPFEPISTLPGHILFPTIEQNKIRQTALFEECDNMRVVFTGELRNQLDNMAQKGDVMARYLYAIWPPALTFAIDSLETDWEWVQKAYSYSAENLIQGEPAGLLAFGQSYANGLFTRANGPLGEAMMRAALRCEGGDGDARIAEAFDDQTFGVIRMQRDGYPMHEDPDIVTFEKQLSELCR